MFVCFCVSCAFLVDCVCAIVTFVMFVFLFGVFGVVEFGLKESFVMLECEVVVFVNFGNFFCWMILVMWWCSCSWFSCLCVLRVVRCL